MDIWKHGKYVDTWSVVHVLSGFLLAGIFYSTSYTLVQAFVSAFIALVAWEVFEWVLKIIEPSMNVLVDLVVGMLGFLCGAYLYYVVQIPFAVSFYGAAAITLGLAAWGFIDFLKRGYR
jgi:hypothetical protein